MSKIKFNEASVPATLTEGAFVVVDGVTYVGNSDNEPVPAKGYLEWAGYVDFGDVEIDTVIRNELDGNIALTKSSTGNYVFTLSSAFTVGKTCVIISPNDSIVSFDGTDSKTRSFSVNESDGNSFTLRFYESIESGTPSAIDTAIKALVKIQVYS